MTGLELAKMFHEVYERLAPDYGYETREDAREFDSESKNGRLMVATCEEILKRIMPDHNSIIGKMYMVRASGFEGFATILGVNDDDTIHVRSYWSGEIYKVEKNDLIEEAFPDGGEGFGWHESSS